MDPLLILSAGTIPATGSVTVKVPLPAGLKKGLTFYRQWAVTTGAVSFVFSNAREVKIQ